MAYDKIDTLFVSVTTTNSKENKVFDNEFVLKCAIDYLNKDNACYVEQSLYQEKLATIDSVIQIP